MRGFAAGSPLLASLAVSATLLGSRVAAETAWTNPVAGDWSDPANWSAGVPAADETAILPQLDADGYEVVLTGSVQCGEVRVLATGVVITHSPAGGQLAVGSLTIGQPGADGQLTVDSTPVTAGSTLVGGNGSVGELVFVGGSQFGGGWLSCGLGSGAHSAGAVSVYGGSQLFIAQMVLGDASALTLQARLDGPTLSASSLVRNGSLAIIVPDGTVLPSPAFTLATTWTAMSGGFDSVAPITIGGYQLPASISSFFILVTNCDPIVSLDVQPTSTPFVGFDVPLTTIGTRISGSQSPVSASYQLLDPATATLEGSKMTPVSGAPIPIVASATTFGVPVSNTTVLTPALSPSLVDGRVDVSNAGAAGNGYMQYIGTCARITPDGRFVAFASKSTNLTTSDAWPNHLNVFIKDRWTGEIEQVDVDGEWGQFAADAGDVDVSDDGRFVVFLRAAASTAPLRAVWIRDRQLGTTKAVSVAADGSLSTAAPSSPRISGDGRFVVYTSGSNVILPGLPGDWWQVLLYDVATGLHTLVSAAPDGAPADGDCEAPAISPDGRWVVFGTVAKNLVDDDAGYERIILVDRASGTLERIDVGSAGGGTAWATQPSLTADGRFVVFASNSMNLGAAPDDAKHDVFLRDRLTGTTNWVSLGAGDPFNDIPYAYPEISEDGSTLLYAGLWASGSQAKLQIRADRVSGATEVVVLDPWGLPVEPGALRADLTADGKTIAVVASADDLIPFADSSSSGLFIRLFGSDSPADLNADGNVNAADLALLLGAWGSVGSAFDLDGDEVVGAGDLAILIGDWTV